jgi:hypothetical protein
VAVAGFFIYIVVLLIVCTLYAYTHSTVFIWIAIGLGLLLYVPEGRWLDWLEWLYEKVGAIILIGVFSFIVVAPIVFFIMDPSWGTFGLLIIPLMIVVPLLSDLRDWWRNR